MSEALFDIEGWEKDYWRDYCFEKVMSSGFKREQESTVSGQEELRLKNCLKNMLQAHQQVNKSLFEIIKGLEE